MLETKPADVATNAPAIPTAYRPRLRAGFALYCGALVLALLFLFGINGIAMIASSSNVEWYKTHDAQLKIVRTVVDCTVQAIMIPALVLLYLAPNGQRWRFSSTTLLAMAGVDLAILGLHIAGAEAALLTVADRIGEALCWVELWMIAVLAAEAAELLERPDIIHQTEMVGRLITWGGFLWLADLIWSFDSKQTADTATQAAPEGFSLILQVGVFVFQLFVMGRTAIYCGWLAADFSSAQDQRPPGKPA